MGKIIIIGAITRDTLIYLDKNKGNCRVIQDLGGILHIVKTFSILTNYFPKLREKEILPIANIGYDIYDAVVEEMQSLGGNIRLEGLKKCCTKNIHSYILFASEYGTQYDENREEPITYEQVKPYLDNVDFLIVSPMTGFDVSIDVLKNIKKQGLAPIYLDYHILSLQRDKLGNRYLEKREDWLEWCKNCDYLQLNKFEAELLFDSKLKIDSDMKASTEPILDKGVKSIAITFGEKGLAICYKKDSMYKQDIIPAEKFDRVVNTTACGDVFAAGFISYFIEYGELLKAYKFASKIASLRTHVKDVKDLGSCNEKIKEILGAVV